MAEPTWWSLMIFLQVRVCVFTTFYLYAGGGRTPQASSAGTDDEDVWGNRADFWIAAHALVSPQALHVERRTNTRKHARTLAPGGARLHTPGSGRRAACAPTPTSHPCVRGQGRLRCGVPAPSAAPYVLYWD